MAKNGAKVVHVRTSKPKSAKEIAQREKNVAKAAERLLALQAKQLLANVIRKQGYVGTDDVVIDKFNADQDRLQLEADTKFIEAVISTPNVGQIIKRWLRDRINQTPKQVKSLIEEFLKRDQNTNINRIVQHRLNPVLKQDAA